MSGHNNMIPNGHFHKDWQRYIKLWFNQPMKKMRRNKIRIQKIFAKAPRPLDKFRPIVRCPTIRYNTKQRIGKGFTMQELKTVKMNPKFARSIGIAVDKRRHNRSYESMVENTQRLREYRNKLILFPLNKKKEKRPQLLKSLVTKGLNKFAKNFKPEKARVVSDELKNFNAYITLRIARSECKRLSNKMKRATKNKSDMLLDDKK